MRQMDRDRKQVRFVELLEKLDSTHRLNDYEKTEVKVLAKELGYKFMRQQKEYLGVTTRARSTYVIVVLLLIIGGLVGYGAVYWNNTKQAYQDLYLENRITQGERDNYKEQNDSLTAQIEDLTARNNSLATQLNQKPTTVYVPQVEPYKYPTSTTTNCRDNYLGGFTCTSY